MFVILAQDIFLLSLAHPENLRTKNGEKNTTRQLGQIRKTIF